MTTVKGKVTAALADARVTRAEVEGILERAVKDHRISDAEARLFEETPVYPGHNVVDLGILPSVRISDTTFLTARFIYSAGDITGFEAGGGLSIEL